MLQEISRYSTAFDQLLTEAIDADLTDIDEMDTETRLRLINAEDHKVVVAVESQIPQIARAVHRAAHSLRVGARLIYVGAGTSGRLGVLDATECPPTFGVSAASVQGIIAGGRDAMFTSIEGAEDNAEDGASAMIASDVGPDDTVVGISASGRAPFVVGALRQAQKREAVTVAVTNNHPSELDSVATILIAPVVGPEVLAGSTRLKSGTSQKMVLNMISTGAMMEIGKTYGNLMVDVQATNVKLKARAVRIIQQVASCDDAVAKSALEEAGGSAKIAIVMIACGKTRAEAIQALDDAGGFLRKALSAAGGN